MKKAWTICTFEIQRLLKKKQSYLLMFAMPLLFTMIFGSLIGGGSEEKMTILWVDQDDSLLSHALYKNLSEKNHLFQLEKSSAKNAEKKLEMKKVPGAITVKKGFQEEFLKGNVQAVTFHRIPEFTSSATVTQYAANKLVKMKVEMTAATQWSKFSGEPWQVMYKKLEGTSDTRSSAIRKENIAAKNAPLQMNGMSARASGFSIMFVMIMMMSVTGTILEAKKSGVWYRMLSAPATKSEIAAGYFLSFFLTGWIQFGVLMVATHFLFDVRWGDPLSVIVLVSALLLAVVGLGLLIAGLVQTSEQQSAIGNLVVISTCMISGVYWPIEIEPIFMQKMAEFLPQTWALKGFAELMANGGTAFDILDCIGILLGFAILFFVLGMRKIKFE